MNTCEFVPPYLLLRLTDGGTEPDTARCSAHTLAIDEQLRVRRAMPLLARPETAIVSAATGAAWLIHTAGNTAVLPGELVRSAGDTESGDAAVDEAYTGTEASLDLFRTVFARDSYDGRGAPVSVTVHYERDYANAFWDGRQLVFGDGDGRVFDRFTQSIDVLAHEFTHGVVQYAAGLTYSYQSGALNESICDVFASMVKQRMLGQSAADADWLIGEGIFLPAVNGRALRSMSEPGTAYDDPVLGKDPQVGSMDEFIETTDDNGGVHLNSGIPNRAFHLVATELGGNSWEAAGAIWYAALTSGLAPSTDFATFAQATIAAAEGGAALDAVSSAWETVGVNPSDAASVPGPQPVPADGVVRVRKSGGFAGMTESGEVDLSSDPRGPQVVQLLTRIDINRIAIVPPQPDRFVYDFELPQTRLSVPEQALTVELTLLARIVLDNDPLR